MSRSAATLRTSIAFALLALAGPASAYQPHFRAQPLNPAGAERLVVRDTAFRCGPSGCAASRSSDRPALVCAALAREVGGLASFSVAGRSFDAAALEACNRRAR